ncbi:MAG: hypothetical protein ACFCBW_07480 [Candidatus Competibacterales bacterium]
MIYSEPQSHPTAPQAHGAIQQYLIHRGISRPLPTGDIVRDRLLHKAYQRLRQRLRRPSLTPRELSRAVDSYQTVVMGVMAPLGRRRGGRA